VYHYGAVEKLFADVPPDQRPKTLAVLLPHVFKTPSFFTRRPCFKPTRMESMRRAVACSVVEHNRRSPPWAQYSLFDPTEYIASSPDYLDRDGHHLPTSQNPQFAEGYLFNYACPGRPTPGQRRISDTNAIDREFSCGEVNRARVDPKWSSGLPSVRNVGIDTVLPWRPEASCACAADGRTDVCSIGVTLQFYLYGVSEPNGEASVLMHRYSVLRDLLARRDNIRYVPTTMDMDAVLNDNVVRHTVGTLLKNSSLFPQCIKNLGYVDPEITTEEWAVLLGSEGDNPSVCSCRTNCSEDGFLANVSAADLFSPDFLKRLQMQLYDPNPVPRRAPVKPKPKKHR
jgi:hypothetical protein